MDPASAIVAALVGGILAGVSRSAEELVTDTYRELRSALLRRYAARDAPRLEHTVQWLEAEPTAPARQQAMAAELHRVGADRDPHLLDLADQLRAVIENPLSSSSPVEQAQRQAGLQALGTVLHQHLDTVLDMRNRFPVDDTDLLSGAGAGSGGPVPAAVQDEVARLHQNIRSVIEQVAQRIEANKHQQTEEALRTLPMAYAERERANAIVQADKRMHISYQTLRTVVEYFSEFNKNLLASIDRERAAGRLANLILGNAITVYELTQFVLEYIERFRLDGYDDVQQLHREARQRLEAKRTEQLALAGRVAGPGVEAPVRDMILEGIRDRDTAIALLEREWDSYLGEVEAIRSKLGEVFEKVPTLEAIRDNARLQIDVMQEVAILRFLRMNADALRGTVSTLQGFRLAALTGRQVCRLVGVEDRRA